MYSAAVSQQQAAVQAVQAEIEMQTAEQFQFPPASHDELQTEIDAIGLEVDRLMKSTESSVVSPD